MDTILELRPTHDGRKRWSRTDCRFLETAQLLTEHYELLDGEIIIKVGQNPPHAIAVMRVIAYLLALFGPDRVRTQATMEVREQDRPTNRPEPDVAALREATSSLPTGEEVLLAVEISDTTQADDYGRKVSLYARAGVSEYWIVDLVRRVVVVHQTPQGDDWLTRAEYGENDALSPLAAPDAKVSAADLLPPREQE